MSLSSNALCAKAKAMYGRRITKEQYVELSKKMSLSDVVSYLKTQTNYQDTFKDLNVRLAHRQQIEDCLDREYYHRCASLIRYADKENLDFYRYEIVSIEIQAIMKKMLALKNNDNVRFDMSIPQHVSLKTSFNIDGLVNIDSFESLVNYLKKTRYYKVLKDVDFQYNLDLNDIYIKLETVYYENIVSIIEKNYDGNLKKDLLNILYTSIELKNITKLYRFKEYFHADKETIKKSIFMDYTRLPKDMIEELLEAPTSKDVLKILATSKYHNYYDDREYAYIEYSFEDVKYNIARRYMRFSNSAPLVYMTYCILQRIEIDNLKHIVEGVRYGQSASKIEANLIMA